MEKVSVLWGTKVADFVVHDRWICFSMFLILCFNTLFSILYTDFMECDNCQNYFFVHSTVDGFIFCTKHFLKKKKAYQKYLYTYTILLSYVLFDVFISRLDVKIRAW